MKDKLKRWTDRTTVRRVLTYFKKLLRKIFSGFFSGLLDFFGLLSLIFHFNLPDFPLYITAILLIIIITTGSYKVWVEERIEREKAQRELLVAKNKIPDYAIRIHIDPTVFDVKRKMSLVDHEIKEEKNNLNDKYFLDGFLPEMKVIGKEKPEDKIQRLTEYLHELKEYDGDIKKLHRISIEISSNKSDENVEIEVKTIDSDPLFIEDDYVKNNIPTTMDPTKPWLLDDHDYKLPSIGTNDYVEAGNIAKIFLKELNPKRYYKIPDQEFYVKTRHREVTLVVTIYSKNLPEPKKIRKKIVLKK